KTLISEDLSVEQGETLRIFFNVTYQENGAFVGGLQLFANTSRSGNKIYAVENNNMYSLDITAGINENEGQIEIYIYKTLTDEEISAGDQINITITQRKIESTSQKESPFALPIALALAAVLLGCFGFLASKLLR
ncbi:MAG: hypothetical protein ACXAB4_10350, partial [Candidatus Hodarchaeales archaeon]